MSHYELISLAQRIRLAKYLIEQGRGDQAAEILRNVADWVMCLARQPEPIAVSGGRLFGDAILDEARKQMHG